MKYLKSREDFLMESKLNEGKFGDFVKGAADKIKKLVLKATRFFKIPVGNNVFLTASDSGDFVPVQNIETALVNTAGKKGVFISVPKEVSAELNKEGVGGAVSKPEDYIKFRESQPDYAKEELEDIVKHTKGDKSYKDMITKSIERGVNESFENKKELQKLFEETGDWDFAKENNPRAGIPQGINDENSSAFGVKVRNMLGDDFEKTVAARLMVDDYDKVDVPPMLVFGGPGIGKTAIPRAVVNAYNKVHGEKMGNKAFIAIMCPTLDLTAFSLPGFNIQTTTVKDSVEKFFDIPKTDDVKDVLKKHQEFSSRLGKEYADTKNSLSFKIKKLLDKGETPEGTLIAQALIEKRKIAADYPKTWLPVYAPTNDADLNELYNMLANCYGTINKEGETYKSINGGVLFLDEFARANPTIRDAVMGLLNEREFNHFRLGSKWYLIAASNRPGEQINMYQNTGEAALDQAQVQRAQLVNFVQTYDSWKKYATGEVKDDEGKVIGTNEHIWEWIYEFLDYYDGERETITKKQYDENGGISNKDDVTNPEYFFKEPIEGKEMMIPWPSPRNWSKACNILFHVEKLLTTDKDDPTKTVLSFDYRDTEKMNRLATTLLDVVGEEATNALMAFYNVTHKIDPSKMRTLWEKNADEVIKVLQKTIKEKNVGAVVYMIKLGAMNYWRDVVKRAGGMSNFPKYDVSDVLVEDGSILNEYIPFYPTTEEWNNFCRNLLEITESFNEKQSNLVYALIDDILRIFCYTKNSNHTPYLRMDKMFVKPDKEWYEQKCSSDPSMTNKEYIDKFKAGEVRIKNYTIIIGAYPNCELWGKYDTPEFEKLCDRFKTISNSVDQSLFKGIH